jgi:ABC-type antimicrobial peptide transport system permease subunit
MSISKKERSFSIWIGIAIGVALSSMLVRYALEKKETQTKERPGNYESLQCASGGEPFHPLPEPIKEKIPYGIVVYFENNQTTEDFNQTVFQRSWIIESSGSFRSERLFIWLRNDQAVPSSMKNVSTTFIEHLKFTYSPTPE